MPQAPSAADRLGTEIPGWLTSFVGRQDELAQLTQLLTGESRLVTLCGLGGAGKSRLAAELTCRLTLERAEAPTTIWWVPMASLTDPLSVPTEVAGTLGLAANAGATAEDLLVKRLSGASTLLVLDNCEHVAAASGALVSVLLARCPRLRVLTTSRTPLGLSGEQVFPVPPMTAADDAVRAGSDAVELFVRRSRLVAPAGNVDPQDPAIAELCDRLAGLPLAIELAAAWTRLLSPADLLNEIARGEEVLVSDLADLPDRHRNLTVMLASTWRALDSEQQRVLARLGIFTGSFTSEAAEVVSGSSLQQLRALAEASLLQRIPDGPTGARFRVHELIRTFALHQAEEADPALVETAQAARFDYLLGLVERAAMTEMPEEPQWMTSFDADLGNIRAAMTWALDRGDSDLALRVSVSLFSIWAYAPAAAHTVELVDRALALPVVSTDAQSLRNRAWVLDHGGYAALGDTSPRNFTPDLTLAGVRFAEEFTVWERLGDERGMARSLRGSGHTSVHAGEWAAARALIERSLAVSQVADDRHGLAWSANDLAMWHDANGDPERAEAGWRDALGRFDQLGVRFGVYRVHLSTGILSLRREDWAMAGERLRLAVQVRDFEHFVYHGSILLRAAASLAAALRRSSAAAELFGAASTWEDTYGVCSHEGEVAVFDAGVARCQRQLTAGEWDAGYRTGAGWTAAQAMRAADRVLEELAAALRTRPAGLTEREVEVLRLVAVGLSNDDIAQRLVISPRTVHAHVRAVFAKLGVSTRTAAAHEAGLLNLL